jgi:hypothetical protein
MGAELMSFRISAGVSLWEPVYQPRHSSTRRRRGGSGRLVQAAGDALRFGRTRRPEPPYLSAPLRPLPLASAPQFWPADSDEDPTLEMPMVLGDRLRSSYPFFLVRPYVVAATAGF